MPVATSRDLYVDALLTDVSIRYRNLGYIADQLFPVLNVNKQSGLVPRFTKSHWFRNEARLRAPGTKSEGGGWAVDTPLSYYTPRYSYRDEIDDEIRDNADNVYNLEATSVEFVTDKLQMMREIQFATSFFTTSKWTGDVTVTSKWDDYTASYPFIDLTDGMDTMEARIANEPNVLVLGKQVWNKLRWHPDLVDSIKYTQTGIPTMSLLAQAIGVDRILIGKAIYTASPEGTAEGSVVYSRIWGKHALFMYLPPRPSLNQPAGGYTFVWNRIPNALQYIKRMRDEEKEIDIIEANGYWSMQQTSADAGLFYGSVVN